MITCLVIEIVEEEKKGLGEHNFETPPRIGEWICLSESTVPVMFEVKMIVHPDGYIKGSQTCSADIYVTRISSQVEALLSLKNNKL